MPKLMTKIIIDEVRLVELIKMRPELYDPLNEYSKDNNRKKIVWNEVSMELNAPVDIVKRVWRKMKMNYVKGCKDQEIRKSPRLNLVEGNLDFLQNIRVNANGNSPSSATTTSTTTTTTTSEHRESPKRVLRSGLQLSTINETKLASLSSSFDSNKTETIVFHDNAHEESTNDDTNDQTNQKDIGYSGKLTNNIYQQENIQQTQLIIDKSERTLRPRQLAMLTVATKENNSPLPSPRIISNRIKNKQKKFINFPAATRAFFESMAMTVSTFPLHYQASIKIKICNIVAETEYKLSLEQKT